MKVKKEDSSICYIRLPKADEKYLREECKALRADFSTFLRMLIFEAINRRKNKLGD
ncbi:MAG: hypothetical protein HQL06_08855 [Nitrospirae bacterium]|nr:hypothetical protein [Nitrospirota bacterium]